MCLNPDIAAASSHEEFLLQLVSNWSKHQEQVAVAGVFTTDWAQHPNVSLKEKNTIIYAYQTLKGQKTMQEWKNVTTGRKGVESNYLLLA